MVQVDEVAGPVHRRPKAGEGSAVPGGQHKQQQNGAEDVQGVDQLQVGDALPSGEAQPAGARVPGGKDHRQHGDQRGVVLQQGQELGVGLARAAPGQVVHQVGQEHPVAIGKLHAGEDGAQDGLEVQGT